MAWKTTVFALIAVAGSFSWQSQRGLIVLDGAQALTAASAEQSASSGLSASDFTADGGAVNQSFASASPRTGNRFGSPPGRDLPSGPESDDHGSADNTAEPTDPMADRIGSRIIEAISGPEQDPGLGVGTPAGDLNQSDVSLPSDPSGPSFAGLGGGGSNFGFVPQPPGGGFLTPANTTDPVAPDTPTTPPVPLVSPVPEPSTWVMLVLGFLAIGAGMRRATRRKSALPNFSRQ